MGRYGRDHHAHTRCLLDGCSRNERCEPQRRRRRWRQRGRWRQRQRDQYLAINDHNQTAGYWQDTAGSQHGFVYDLAAGTFAFLDAPDAAPVMGVTTTQIVGINNAGDLAGFFIDANGVQHGFYATPNH